jgi:hypothetical protein
MKNAMKWYDRPIKINRHPIEQYARMGWREKAWWMPGGWYLNVDSYEKRKFLCQ